MHAMIGICFWSALILLAVVVLFALLPSISSKRIKDYPKLLICFFAFFLAGIFLNYPLHLNFLHATGEPFRIDALFASIHHTLRMFVLDGELDQVREFAGSLSGKYANSYFYLAAFVYIASPILTFSAVLSAFRNISSFLKYSTHFFSETCIFPT